MSFDSDAVTMGGVAARDAARGCASSGSTRSARTTAAARPRRSPRSRRWPATASRSPRSRTSASRRFTGDAARVPARDAGVLRRVRRPRARARRARDRRLLRHDAGADRGDPRGGRREPQARTPCRARGSAQRSRSPPRPRSRRSSSGCSPPASSSSRCSSIRRSAARRRASSRPRRAIRESGLAQVVDVNDNPRARARMSGLMASVAHPARGGHRGRAAPDPARLDDRRARVAAARRARRGRAQRPRGDRRRPGAGRLSRHGLGVRRRRDRARRADDAAERRHDFHGRAIDAPTSFFPGVAVNPTADDLELEAERFRRKVDAGARFAMTQIVFDLSYLEAFLERIGGSPIPLLVGVWPIRSLELALRVHNETPGIVVPEHVQERYRAAGPGRGAGRRRAGARADRGRARARGRRLRRRAVPAAARASSICSAA